jgi:hypothetical protein
MDLTKRKNKLIDAFRKIDDESLLARVESLVFHKKHSSSKKGLLDFAGIWDDKSASQIKAAIEEACGKIDHNDW